MKKLDQDWPSDTLEMADWVAYRVKTGWLASWQTENTDRNGLHLLKNGLTDMLKPAD